MRLSAGGIREMHWHRAAEWAFIAEAPDSSANNNAKGHGFLMGTMVSP